jgi:uncharacterized protein YjdB
MLLGCALLAPVACSDDDEVTAPSGGVNVPTVVITPGTSTLRPGATVQLAAEVRDGATGNVLTGQTVRWASADTAIVRISESGLVTVVGPGIAGITARYGPGALGTASVVVLGPVTAVALSGPVTTVEVGLTTQLTARAIDAAGVPQPRAITYTSSNPAVATVSSTGMVTALSAGSTTITATSEGRSATFTLTTFVPTPVATVTLNTASQFVAQGNTFQLTATLRDSVGGPITGRVITWTSSAPAVATVSAAGLVTVVGGGTTTITATREGRSATATITNVLTSGVPMTISGPGANSERFYYVNVPATATAVSVTLRSGTGDPDLYVYRTGSTAAACTQESDGPTETCNVTASGTPGLYRIRVVGFSAYAGTTLLATVTP